MSELQDNRANGVVYTPPAVATEVARVGLLAVGGPGGRILEPSAGDGAFLRALLLSGVEECRITAVDIDGAATSALAETHSRATIVEADFLEYASRDNIGTFSLVIGNPPFIKRVAYTPAFSERIGVLAREAGVSVGELRNAWAAFVVAAAKLVDDGGALVLIVPYEMITVKYGRRVQCHLLSEGFTVEIFVPDQKTFPAIEQDAVILVATRAAGGQGYLRVNRVESSTKLNPTRTATVNTDNERVSAIGVKSILLDDEIVGLLERLRERAKLIGEYCESAAGIVTAANEYFILSDEAAERKGLLPWARRIVKKGSYLPKGPVFSEKDLTRISRKEPCNLIDFHWAFGPPLSDVAERYIEECEEMQLHQRYKCSRRNPWFRIPIVGAGEGLFFKRAHVFPRLCINAVEVLVTDTAYQVRMGDEYGIQGFVFFVL